MIIAFIGKKGSGKTTLSEYIVKNYWYTLLNFSDPLKEICKIVFDFSDEQLYGEKKEEIDTRWNICPREILQKVGNEMFKNELNRLFPDISHKNVWISNMRNKIQSNRNYVIGDMRFLSEYTFIKKMGGIVIRVIRGDVKENEYSSHISETEMDDIEEDFTICNDGDLKELYSNMDNLMKKFT